MACLVPFVALKKRSSTVWLDNEKLAFIALKKRASTMLLTAVPNIVQVFQLTVWNFWMNYVHCKIWKMEEETNLFLVLHYLTIIYLTFLIIFTMFVQVFFFPIT